MIMDEAMNNYNITTNMPDDFKILLDKLPFKKARKSLLIFLLRLRLKEIWIL